MDLVSRCTGTVSMPLIVEGGIKYPGRGPGPPDCSGIDSAYWAGGYS